jgi:hypothetical protein
MKVFHAYDVFTSAYLTSQYVLNESELPIISPQVLWTEKTPPNNLDAGRGAFFSFIKNDWVVDYLYEPTDNSIILNTVARVNQDAKVTVLSDGVFIFDDIFENPVDVFNEAKSSEKYQRSLYGCAKSFNYDVSGIVNLLKLKLGFDFFPSPNTHCGAYKLNIAENEYARNPIHGDANSGRLGYAGIIYLNLPQDCSGGTTLYRHKASKELYRNSEAKPLADRIAQWIDGYFLERWDEIQTIEMKFNRLALYPAKRFHRETSFFNGRLVQTLFLGQSIVKR